MPATVARARKQSCFAQAVAAGHSLRFSAATETTGGTASLTLRSRAKPTLLTQVLACAPQVAVGHSYRASFEYRSSSANVSLEVLTHSSHGWKVWYVITGRLAKARAFKSSSTLLRAIQGGVDHVALGLLVKSGGTVQARHFNFVDATQSTPLPKVLTETTTTPPASTTPVSITPPAPTETGGCKTPPGFGLGSTEVKGNETNGVWEVIEGSDHARAIHAVLLQNGKLLIMAGSGNERMEFERGCFRSYVYDPVANTWKEIETPKDVFCSGHVQLADGNVLILGGTSAYPPPPEPGKLPSTEYKGENASWIFNIHTEKYEEVPWNKEHPNQPVEPGPALSGVWYPSMTELGNGDVVSFGGLNERGWGATSSNYFIGPYNKSVKGDPPGEWVGWESELQQTYGWFWGLYPTMILTADGRLFYTGSHVFGDGVEKEPFAPGGSSIYDFYCTPGKSTAEEEKETDSNGKGETNPNAIVKGPNGEFPRVQSTPGLEKPDQRDQSASLLLPPAQEQKVMIMGGGNTYNPNEPATSSTQVIDLAEGSPEWKAGPELPAGETERGEMEGMGEGKMYVSAVALPDETVLETGGSRLPRTDNVHESAIFNPKTGKFTPVTPDPVGRNYHSEALLLPDGRVLALGSNPVIGVNGEEGWETRLSIFKPHYLFKGARPSIGLIDGMSNELVGSFNHTSQWEYGSSNEVEYSSKSSEITSAVLIRPAAVTHSSDPNQREIKLPITGGSGAAGEKLKIKVSLTSNPDIAPPGYYMLFLVNANGVPSVAQWVHVGPQGEP